MKYNDPARLIPLSEIAELVNEVFPNLGYTIGQATPYAWWDRSKKNQDISLPMPEPTMVVPGKPLWSQEVLVHWFAAWQGLDVPVGVPAGDRIDSRGRRVFSKYRAVK